MKAIIIFYAHVSEHMPATATFAVESTEELIYRINKFKRDIKTWFKEEPEYSWLIMNYNEFNSYHIGLEKILINVFGKNNYSEKLVDN